MLPNVRKASMALVSSNGSKIMKQLHYHINFSCQLLPRLFIFHLNLYIKNYSKSESIFPVKVPKYCRETTTLRYFQKLISSVKNENRIKN